MTVKQAKLELRQLVREAETADYVPMVDLDRSIYLAKFILANGGKL